MRNGMHDLALLEKEIAAQLIQQKAFQVARVCLCVYLRVYLTLHRATYIDCNFRGNTNDTD